MKGLFNNMGEAASRLGYKAAFKLKKAAPELLLIGGIACIVGGTIMACKATKKASDILDDGHEDVEELKSELEGNTQMISPEEEKLVKKDIAKTKLRTLGRIAVAYAPAVAVGSAGIAMIFTSHGIMKRRHGMLLASYNALDAAFKTYRARVLEEEDGKERDRRYLRGDVRDLTADEMNEFKFVDKVNQDAARMIDDSAWDGPYCCQFDARTSGRFSMHPFSNLNTIREVETIMTNRLHLKGYIFLNEVLYELAMDPVPWGQLVGWNWDSDGEYDTIDISAVEEFPDTPGSSITLEFNCDGAIWDKL